MVQTDRQQDSPIFRDDTLQIKHYIDDVNIQNTQPPEPYGATKQAQQKIKYHSQRARETKTEHVNREIQRIKRTPSVSGRKRKGIGK